MDPDKVLEELREMANNILRGTYDQRFEGGAELAEKIEALDEWLSNGGFRPEEWHPSTGKVINDDLVARRARLLPRTVPMSQACKYGGHVRCPGENTLGTSKCECECHSA